VYIDESGIDHNIIKEHCWIKKGTELVGERSGKARGRTSVIAALNGENINAPMTYQGTMNTALFLCWIETFLLPSLAKDQVVIMDNASIHKNNKVRELIESVGCKLLYLPPYSPDFNPIENYWAVMKKNIRKIRSKCDNITEAIDTTLQSLKKHFYS
jgi:transposase